MLAEIAADGCYSTTEALLNDITIFELTNHECRYFGKQFDVSGNAKVVSL
jgi:hypothetical protein